jgi:hypothetical protein
MRLGNSVYDPKTYEGQVYLAGIYYSITVDKLLILCQN